MDNCAIQEELAVWWSYPPGVSAPSEYDRQTRVHLYEAVTRHVISIYK
jgi:hypothetical protein